jgi:hypothetical protein
MFTTTVHRILKRVNDKPILLLEPVRDKCYPWIISHKEFCFAALLEESGFYPYRSYMNRELPTHSGLYYSYVYQKSSFHLFEIQKQKCVRDIYISIYFQNRIKLRMIDPHVYYIFLFYQPKAFNRLTTLISQGSFHQDHEIDHEECFERTITSLYL